MKYLPTLLLLVMAPLAVFAQDNFTENFDLNIGALNNQNQWMGNTAFQVITDAMTLADYPQTNAEEKVLKLQSSGGNIGRDQLLLTPFASGSAYLSFLIRIDDKDQLPTAPAYQIALEKAAFSTTFAGFGFYQDLPSGTIRAALTTQSGIDEVTSSQTFSLATVYHVVLKYEFAPAANDILQVFISPTFMPTEPTTPVLATTVNGTGLPDNIGRLLINAPAGSSNMAVIDGIQFGNVWNGFFDLSLLPVELVQFRGYSRDNSVQLSWSTLSERNNELFLIERSADGQHFMTVGQVAGVGDSQHVQDYTYRDFHPDPGLNYYRLTQRDFSGESNKSEIIGVMYQQNTPQLNLYPNPTSDFLIVEGLEVDPSEMSIRRSNGMLAPLVAQPQTNGILIDVHDYPSGWYVLEITGAQHGYQAFSFVVH